MQAKIHTLLNYRNLNGQVLPVVEIMTSPYSGIKRVTCQIYAHEFGKYIKIVFYGDEASTIKGGTTRKKKGGSRVSGK